MSLTVALLRPVPEHGIDETESEFELDAETISMLDRLVGTGFGTDRAEVMHNVLKHALRRNASIGRCDLCGLVDHYLVEGACPPCRVRYAIPENTIDARRQA